MKDLYLLISLTNMNTISSDTISSDTISSDTISSDTISSDTISSNTTPTDSDYTNFWNSVNKHWGVIYEAFTRGNQNDVVRANELLNFFLGNTLSQYLEIETTVGEINRIAFESANQLVEIYISPRLKRENIPYMEKLYSTSVVLPNLQINKYRAYNVKDALIEDISYEDYKVSYTDIGCQSNLAYDSEHKPVINLVLYVKKSIAARILEKKKITAILPDGSKTEVDKWLPVNSNAIDILLLNTIGEYNFIHNIGYIEFLPEGDPLIVDGSIFTELKDIKGSLEILEKCRNVSICQVCNRHELQRNILRCKRCKVARYCCRECQIIDYKIHKTICN